jgi:uncharacterized NAD(P)/FAD-binding protein YdhS
MTPAQPALPVYSRAVAPQAMYPGRGKLPVAVIGSGFSGTMVAIHLAGWLPPDQPILLCERGAFARGTAYATPNQDHLLNVRASNMSAFPRQADHFERWLEHAPAEHADQTCHTEAGAFASRGVYGRYLFSLLNRAVAGNRDRVRPMHAEVLDIEPDGDGYRLLCADGGSYPVAAVVLAVGNVPAVPADSPLCRNNPWSPDAMAGLRPDEPVLIVGTGLTMVDLALELSGSGFSGPVVAVSRRGLLPHWHAVTKRWPTPSFTEHERASLPRLLAHMRQELREAAELGVDWRSVIDSMRPITADLWRGLPDAERQRFLRHLRPFWDVHRHRLAPPVADRLGTLLSSGYLTIRRGRIVGTQYNADTAEVSIRARGAVRPDKLVVQRIVNATGMQSANCADSALIGNLCRRGLARLDPLGLGLDVTDGLQVADASGQPVPNIWALGPIVRGVFWECVAVPDIRTQAERVARHVWAFVEGRQTAIGGQ